MNDNVGPKDSPFPAAGWTGSQLAPAQTPQDFFATAAEIKRRLGHHSRVPVLRQSREDVAGRQRPVCRTYKAPSNAVLLGPFQLTPAMGYVPAFLLGTNGTVRSAHSRGSCRGRGVVEAVSRGPFTSPKPSRPARRFPFDANVCRTRPVERCVSELSLNDTKIVTEWAILGRY